MVELPSFNQFILEVMVYCSVASIQNYLLLSRSSWWPLATHSDPSKPNLERQLAFNILKIKMARQIGLCVLLLFHLLMMRRT